MDGTTTNHHKHRHQVVDYMRQHREDFEPFVEDDVPFERHCEYMCVCVCVFIYLVVVYRA